jgi:general L-amino acid transport system substrate-binding protein
MPRRHAALAAALLCCALLAAGAARAQGSGSPTLDAVRGRGQLVCGVAGNVAGFSLADSQGVIRGLDADGCRALAAAVLGDAAKVTFVPTTTQNRFTALQSGEVDVLIRETTWTLGREASLGLEFAGVNFYDGTGFLVKKSAGVSSAKQLDGATICVQPGTSTELAIADYFRVNNMKFTPIEIQDVQELRSAFLSGRCDVYSTDSSALATFRAGLGAGAADFVLLPELISKEPLGPMVRKGDDRWFDIVRWTLYAQIAAEEIGVTSQNVDGFATTTDPTIRRLLGLDGDLGKALGLDNKWAYNAIKQVGNYGEMWARDMAPLGVPRGRNDLWTKGGLMYAPPIR